MIRTLSMLTLFFAAPLAMAAAEVGVRPYELDWAGRLADDHPPLVDCEDLSGWHVETEEAVASLECSREQQIWGDHVAKLTYRGTGTMPVVRLRPPLPLPIDQPFDAATCWIYGNNWAWVSDRTTPQTDVSLLFLTRGDDEVAIPLVRVNWQEWFLCYRALTSQQREAFRGGARFSGIEVRNGTNLDDRVLFFDNVAVFNEAFAPLTFQPRPKRGIPMFPGQQSGTNTGPGELPFPTRTETILPPNLAGNSTTRVTQQGDAFLFVYTGEDGTLTYRYAPALGTWSDLTAAWQGRGQAFQPLADGGIRFPVAGGPDQPPQVLDKLSVTLRDGVVVSRWRASLGTVRVEVEYHLRLWGKTLVLDTLCPGGGVSAVCYGQAVGLPTPRLVTLPYYDYGGSRPAVVVSGPATAPLFVSGHTDWTLSNASTIWAENEVDGGRVTYQGGVRYTPCTNGTRNDCYERFFVTVSPRFEEVLPTIPNPVSPWKQVTGKGVWRAHGAGNRDHDRQTWARVHRYGMRHIIVTDHETGWRDGGESFTFRTRAAPGKGGDKGQYDYARFMQDDLGFVYGPYNNYTDFAPVNEYWRPDLISRSSDGQLQTAWARCYAPKPARAVEYCAELAPLIQEKFKFSTAYCDVHTCVTPWSRTDYDSRVPGAGTFAGVFYAYGEIMLLQKEAWGGPVYSEGGKHSFYCGLTDGNYAQDQDYRIPFNPWLVDFDLRQLHDLGCNFGMGSPDMFYESKRGLGDTPEKMDAAVDRFLAATVAFGHPGFLVLAGGFRNGMRSYYMIQQLAARYTQVPVDTIRYVDEAGTHLDTSAAVASGVFQRSQVVCRYTDGTLVAANGSPTETMHTTVEGREIELPPAGYMGWTADGAVSVFSGLVNGHRADYAATPEYVYVDGRGRNACFPRACGSGLSVCRTTDTGWEVIPLNDAVCGFEVSAVSAHALDESRNVLGPAELRRSRGLTYVMPVTGAVSYELIKGDVQEAVVLSCPRAIVVPGETVTVTGKEEHRVILAADAVPGTRIWQHLEDAWIDFAVESLVEMRGELEGDRLDVTLRPNVSAAVSGEVTVAGQSKAVELIPANTSVVSFDLGPAAHEDAGILAATVMAAGLSCVEEWGMEIRAGHVSFGLPEVFKTGMRNGDAAETFAVVGSGANANRREDLTCGGVSRPGLFMHPPWERGAYGYTFALFDPVRLPTTPDTAFRAFVGKQDGSHLGDGIVYRVIVVDAAAKESIVAEEKVVTHTWQPIEADLTRWAGQRIRLKLVADCGPANDTAGDWSAWGDLRLESRDETLIRRLSDDASSYRREPGPAPIQGLTLAELRAARQGWLHYEGKGLSGTGSYGTLAFLNGVALGNLAPANGDETQGIFCDPVSVPLTSDALSALRWWNEFEIENPSEDCFSVRRFWLEVELADGRRCSSYITPATYSQPGTWAHAEGIGVAQSARVRVSIWFPE